MTINYAMVYIDSPLKSHKPQSLQIFSNGSGPNILPPVWRLLLCTLCGIKYPVEIAEFNW